MTYDFDHPGDKVRSPSKLSHVVLRTNNFQKMKQFYKTFLGAHPTHEDENFSFMTYDGEHHRIGIFNIPHLASKNPETSGLEHISFTFETLSDLAISYLQRKANGIEPFWATNHGPTTSVYYKDPDGNILETQVDNFDTIDDAMAFVQSDAYKTNPIGVDFEVEYLVKRLRSGEDDASIKKRFEIGPRGIDSVPMD